VKVARIFILAVIGVNLALLACYGPFRATQTRYELSRKQAELRRISLENQVLLERVAAARRPDQVAARAVALGVDLRCIETADMVTRAPEIRPGR
jgi:hypothetical protein